MIQKYGMHRLTNIVVASEGETQITHTTADMSAFQVLMYPFRRTDKVCCIAVVLLHTRCHSEYIGVEDDVERIHAHLHCQQFVGSLGNLNPSLIAGSLSLFVKTHHHHRSPIALHITGMFQELLLTLFQRDGVDDTLTLHALQTCYNHLPV